MKIRNTFHTETQVHLTRRGLRRLRQLGGETSPLAGGGKMNTHHCPHCGQLVSLEIVQGYMSRAELGRPRGARGEDLSYPVSMCSVHGEVSPVEVDDQDEWEAWVSQNIPRTFPGGKRQGNILVWEEGREAYSAGAIPRGEIPWDAEKILAMCQEQIEKEKKGEGE